MGDTGHTCCHPRPTTNAGMSVRRGSETVPSAPLMGEDTGSERPQRLLASPYNQPRGVPTGCWTHSPRVPERAPSLLLPHTPLLERPMRDLSFMPLTHNPLGTWLVRLRSLAGDTAASRYQPLVSFRVTHGHLTWQGPHYSAARLAEDRRCQTQVHLPGPPVYPCLPRRVTGLGLATSQSHRSCPESSVPRPECHCPSRPRFSPLENKEPGQLMGGLCFCTYVIIYLILQQMAACALRAEKQ